MRVTWRDVSSSNIKRVGWDNGAAHIEFMSGRRFAYEVPKTVFDALVAAPSVGSFFARQIKGTARIASSGWACSNSPCLEDATVQGKGAGDGVFYLCAACQKLPRFARIEFAPISTATEGKK